MRFLAAIAIFLVTSILVMSNANAQMRVYEVRSLLLQYNISEKEADSIIGILESNLSVEKRSDILPISGILYTSGFNGAFFVDHDTWELNATFRSPETDQLITLPEFITVDFRNGGIKIELSYKWMFVIVPSGTSIQSLNGASYGGPLLGRGAGITIDPGIGIDVAAMTGVNRGGCLFVIAPKVGFGAGLVFPRMDFSVKSVNR